MTTTPSAEERRDTESRDSRAYPVAGPLLGRRPELTTVRGAGVLLAEFALGCA